jgi:hypothetical protein
MKKVLQLLVLLSFIYACGDAEKNNQLDQDQGTTNETVQNKIVSIDFHNNKFNSIEKKLLHELDSLRFFNSIPQRIFIEIPKDQRDKLLSEKYFNFMPLYPNKSLNEGFIMTVSGELFMDRKFATMTNRSFIFERVNNSLILVNSFKGFIKELKAVNSSTPSDLVLEFNSEKENAYFYCLYSWNSGKFEFNKCIGFSEDKGNTQIKYTEEQSNEFSPEIKEIVQKESFAF